MLTRYFSVQESITSSTQTNSWPRPCKGSELSYAASVDMSAFEDLKRNFERLRLKEKEFEQQKQELMVR